MTRPAPFFKSLSTLLLLNILVKPVWIFFIDRVVQNELGFELYGKYFALLNLSYVLLFLADAGLSNMLNQQVAKRGSINLRQAVVAKLVLLLLYTSIGIIIGRIAGVSTGIIFLYVLVVQALNSVFIFLRSIITAYQFFGVDAWLSVVDKGLMILLCAGPLYFSNVFGAISLLLFLQLQLLSTSIAVLVAVLFIAGRKIAWRTQKQNIFHFIRQVVPFALIILLMAAHYRLDGFLLERLHANGAYEAGVYASAYRLLDAANMIGYLAAGFLVPFIARHQQEKSLLDRTLLLTRHGLFFLAIVACSFTWIYAPWLQQLLYHNGSSHNISVMQLCLSVLPAYLLTHIYGSFLTATSRFASFIVVLIISVVINTGLNAWLIPLQGAAGAAKAALVSQYLCAAGCMMYSARQLSLHLSAFGAYIGSAALLLLLFFLADKYDWNVWISLAITIILAGTFIFLQRHKLKKIFTSFQ